MMENQGHITANNKGGWFNFLCSQGVRRAVIEQGG